ncbi:MAG: energy-coupling factor ABC transporter ATP-binding protein [Desulfitobacteriaceae bacterium]
MDPFILVEGVSYIYPGGVKAIDNVSLEIGQGEVVAILGSNGSGKTTLVKHFNGLLKPTKGRVVVHGLDTRKERIAKLSSIVGYVFQNPNHQTFLPSVREELYYGCKNLKLPEDEANRRVQKAIDMFKLENMLDANPFDLISSQRKEVAMASIMAISPQVIVLDEPTTGQDHAGVTRILELVRMFEQNGDTVVLITHDMQLVGELNCRVVVMSKSKKIADDLANRVFTDRSLMKEAALEAPQVTALAENLDYLDKKQTFLTVDSMVEWFKLNTKEGDKFAAGR